MKVAILGYGIEGKSAEEYFRKQNAEIEIFDKFTEADIDGFGLDRFDVVVRTPSIRPRPGWTSVTKIFFDECPCPIVGVTGTKGKGTTSSLIGDILAHAGESVHLVGNIGTSALNALPYITSDSIVVYELSSFQLWDLHKSPHVAVLAHMDVDHLDTHEDEDDYWTAKQNIAMWQTESDFIIYENDNPIAEQIASHSPATKLTYPTHEFDNALTSLTLPGEHNRRNAEAAILAVKCLGVNDEPIWRAGLSVFPGLPHRLKLVKEVNGVEYYDDSYSTIPSSAIAAVKAFRTPKVLILGGSDKGADYSKLASTIRDSSVKHIILVGSEAPKIKSALDAAKAHQDTTIVPGIPYDMARVVGIAAKITSPGDTVILSPAAASFDSFANYGERGDKFIAAVNAL